jgi:hypothetical protein
MSQRRALSALLLAAAASLALTTPAGASKTQEAIFQDDEFLVFSSASTMSRTLDTLKALGTDRVRVTFYWNIIAPDQNSRTRPSFNARDPGKYPQGHWERYDTLVRLAAAKGIGIYFTLNGPVPKWATQPTDNKAVEQVYLPSADEFEQFVEAVGTRYSGSFVPPEPGGASQPSGNGGGGVTLPPRPPLPTQPTAQASQAQATAAQSSPLPRVSFWSIWNEPNEWHFLYPQWSSTGLEQAAVTYRGLVDGAFRGLGRSGHSGDVVLIGETAPKGRDLPGPEVSLKPLRFMRALYCVDRNFRPLTGPRARAMACPESNQRQAFVEQHQGLFYAKGWAPHPYNLAAPPRVRTRDGEDSVSMGDLPKMTNTLRRIFATYGRCCGLNLYPTEFGYQSRPPDPFGFPYAHQSAYINESEWMGYKNPRVRTYSQFLLRDAEPLKQYSPRSYLYWSTFQTGLVHLNGSSKPALSAFRLPIYLPVQRRRRAGNFTVWGAVRPARNGAPQTVEVQYRSSRRAPFIRIKTVRTSNFRGYWETRVRLRRSGEVRASWRSPSGQFLYSRHASVRVG